MADAIPDFRPSPDARDVAEALRTGLDARQSRVDTDVSGADEARLRALGDLEGLPPLAKPGPGAPVIKLSRRILQVFLRPWLAAQTIFNREIARRFQHMITTVRDLERRTPHLESGLERLMQRVQQLEGTIEIPDSSPGQSLDETAAIRGIATMFVHSRLPGPPSRVLMLGDSAWDIAVELAAFGFDVCTEIAGPFAEASFDVVIASSASGLPPDGCTELARALKPGGRLIATLTVPDRVSGSGTTRSTFAPLRVTEMLCVTRSDGVWSVETAGADADGSEAAMVLVVAEA